MLIPPRLLLPVILCGLFAPSAEAEVAVRFVNPEKFKDFTLNSGPVEKIRADLMHELGNHLRALGDRYLPKGDKLEIDVEDVDMAGGFEPWRIDMMFTRIMSDVWPPVITMYYLWKDPQGKVKAEGREAVTNLNYRWMVNVKDYPTQDSLRFEKALLEIWFRERFGGNNRR